jgi:glycine cleavage system H protein
MTGRHEPASCPDTTLREPCVWMSAGLLAYRLCDRQYECETCPLDAALRRADLGPKIRLPGYEVQAHGPGAGQEYPDDRTYGPGHCWVQERSPGSLRLGLDAFGAALLAPLQGIIFPTPGTRLARGEAICWLRVGKRPIPLPAPAGGYLEKVNTDVCRDPALACLAPYGKGWLVELRSDRNEPRKELVDATLARQRGTTDQRLLDHLLSQDRGTGSDSRVGVTLPDGGSPVTSLREILGSARFARLVRKLLR